MSWFKQNIIKKEFPGLSAPQYKAIEAVIEAYVKLIDISKQRLIREEDVPVLTNLIKASLYNVLQVAKVYLR